MHLISLTSLYTRIMLRRDACLCTSHRLHHTAGADACNEESTSATWVTNLTHIVGLFTYALVLGIVSDDVQRLVEGFKTGNSVICERGHTIVLNCNATTAPLLRQVCASSLPHADVPHLTQLHWQVSRHQAASKRCRAHVNSPLAPRDIVEHA